MILALFLFVGTVVALNIRNVEHKSPAQVVVEEHGLKTGCYKAVGFQHEIRLELLDKKIVIPTVRYFGEEPVDIVFCVTDGVFDPSTIKIMDITND